MSKKSFRKNLFEVKNPCAENWEQMKGGEKMRFCGHCASSVNNLSAMRRKDAMRMIREANGRICVRYVKNPQTNEPVFAGNFYQIARRAPRLAVGAMTAALSLSTFAYAQGGVSTARAAIEQTEVAAQRNSQKAATDDPPTRISGTITDQAGAVIPGVSVKLLAENGDTLGSATSNDEGVYEFKNQPAGTYTLKFEAGSGFSELIIEQLKISDGAETKQDATMEIDGETVTVGGIGMIEYELPLLQAVSEGNADAIKSLLASGASVNDRDKNYDGISAIFVAVEQGNVETVRTLLEFGAKINARSDDKRTPLMSLDGDATPELVRTLLAYGAKIKAVDNAGNNVLHRIASYGAADILDILIVEGAKINARNNEGQTPLMIAADYENLEAVKVLLKAGADVNLRDEKNRTALGIALENDYKEIAELLISYGAKK